MWQFYMIVMVLNLIHNVLTSGGYNCILEVNDITWMLEQYLVSFFLLQYF